MEARFGGEANNLFGIGAANTWAQGKRSLEWDLNDWKWDGDLFIARPLNQLQASGISRQLFPIESGVCAIWNSSHGLSLCSNEADPGFDKEKRELEKKKWRVVLIEDENLDDEVEGSLILKLGGQGYSVGEREVENWHGNSGKKIKVVGDTGNRAACQVEDCGFDLSNAKDYHRRHKVCEMHSKAVEALVGNALQRFCQRGLGFTSFKSLMNESGVVVDVWLVIIKG